MTAGTGVQSPLSATGFARRMAALGPFEAAPRLAVAVSGGGDSMALVLLADGWARARGGRVTALTVDHGLRPDSAAEAARVGAWLDGRGIAHRVLAWRGDKPAAGIQAAAREARYKLMTAWCRDAGVLHLLAAHTEDDQAETVLLRLGRGSGADGLAAMAPVVELADVRLLRPLLSVPRARLRATLAAAHQPWLEDPTNDDPAFARTHARRAVHTLAAAGMPAAAVAATATPRARARAARDGAAAALLARACAVHPAGFARLDAGALEAAPADVARRALGRVLMAVGGRAYPPAPDKLRRLAEALPVGGTLAGCRVGPDGDAILVCRETRGLPPPMAVRPGDRLRWDNRFAVAFAAAGGDGDAELAALGADGWAEVVARDPAMRETQVPAPARLPLPALRDDGGVAAVPHLGYRRPDAAGVAFAVAGFRPPGPLAGAPFFLASPNSDTI